MLQYDVVKPESKYFQLLFLMIVKASFLQTTEDFVVKRLQGIGDQQYSTYSG